MAKRKTKIEDTPKLQGIEPDGVIIDELANIPEEVIDEAAKLFVGYHPVTNEEMFA